MFKKILIALAILMSSALSLNGMGKIHPAAFLGPDIDEAYYHSPVTVSKSHPSGLSFEFVERVKKDLSLTDADRNAEEVVYQGVKDYGIKNPVVVLKTEDKNSSPARADRLSESDAYLVIYRPWWHKVIFPNKSEKSKFVFRPDLLPDTQESIATASEPIREDVHPQTQKFVLLHELAHIRHGDCDRKSIKEDRESFGLYANLASIPLCVLAGLKWSSSWANVIKINAASLFVISGASYCYYRYLLGLSRKRERAADDAAYKILLKNNDIKPIVHWILDKMFFLHNRYVCSASIMEAEKYPTTHPSTQNRIDLAKKAILQSKIIWTQEIYRAILDELKDDPNKDYKIKQLNILHRDLLSRQGMKLYAVGLIENKKLYRNAVLTGEKPAHCYLNIKKWA